MGMKTNLLAATAALVTTFGIFAPAAEAQEVALSVAKVQHQLEAARSAQDRLQLHLDRYCLDYCARMKVDIGVVEQGLQNFANQMSNGSADGSASKVDVARAAHQFEAIRSALSRLAFVATKQGDRTRRVEVDVGIVASVVTNLENQTRNALRGLVS